MHDYPLNLYPVFKRRIDKLASMIKKVSTIPILIYGEMSDWPKNP